MDIPTLETRRLKLVPLDASHSAGMFRLWSDPDVCRYSGVVTDRHGTIIEMPAASAHESNRIIEFWLDAAADGWGFRWAVVISGSEEAFAGTVGFNSLTACSELAYHLLPEFWGHGIMAQACRTAIGWRCSRECSEIEAFIEPGNRASIALALRLGMEATDTFYEGAQRYVRPC